MFHGLPSCDLLVPTLYGELSNPSAILLETRHARENVDKFTTKREGKSVESPRAFDIRMVQSLIV
jgi:hypothetical protein